MLIDSALKPRIRFETVTGVTSDALPRMDIAIFVGFAASGPIHVPVVIEDIDQFHRLFGETLFLAWDTHKGDYLSANLEPAVTAFFANGGRRCWIVRVASHQATYNYFQLPGMIKCTRDEQGKILNQQQVFSRARSQGSWSDSIKISARLRSVALAVKTFNLTESKLSLFQSTFKPAPGAMLKLSFGGQSTGEYWLYTQAVEQFSLDDKTTSINPYQLINLNWYSNTPLEPLMSNPADVSVNYSIVKDTNSTKYYFDSDNPFSEPGVDTIDAKHNAKLTRINNVYRLSFIANPSEVLPDFTASPIAITVNENVAWLITGKVIQHVEIINQQGDDENSGIRIELEGELFWERNDILTTPLDVGQLQAAQVISFDLTSLDTQGQTHRLSDIGLCPNHQRYLADMLVDQGRYRPGPDKVPTEFQDEVRNSVFPLASADPVNLKSEILLSFIPLGLSADMSEPLDKILQHLPVLERNGLAEYNSALFLDPDLENVSLRTLMQQADQLRYWAAKPRPLLGIHAVLDNSDSRIIDEATLICTPDAVHRGWGKNESKPATSKVLKNIEENENNIAVMKNQFKDCSILSLQIPELEVAKFSTQERIILKWTGDELSQFRLQESLDETFNVATNIYVGDNPFFSFNRTEGGEFYYRVQAFIQNENSNWSNTIEVIPGSPEIYKVVEESLYQENMLQAVHHSLLNLCAAKGDLFAVLSLPQHYCEKDVEEYIHYLTSGFFRGISPSALSYGALYHPWIKCQDNKQGIVSEPPDGAVLGIFSKRTLSRGAWIAPANEVYRTVLALSSPLMQLESVPVNTIINTSRGYLCWSAKTLEIYDTDLQLINVRRLIILLRRLALRHGSVYAFEPNGEELRRLIQRRFNALLRGMYEQGAFFGSTPQLAYQIDTGAEFNSRQSIENGRLIVALKICPSRPMEYIVIKLTQTGEQLNVVDER